MKIPNPTNNHESPFDQSEFDRASDHFRHAAGKPVPPEYLYWRKLPAREIKRINNRLRYCAWVDKAWTVMLYRCGLLKSETAARLLPILRETGEEAGFGGEPWLRERLGGDEDTASMVNLGRTLQEPMARMQLRDKLLDVFDALLTAMRVVLDKASENEATIMPGSSHMSHAQPTTYGAYLVSVYDGLARGLELLEVAYRHTDCNSSGCGACSGSGWPIDRVMISELLGFQSLIEPVYDCEASQDEVLTIHFALTHFNVLLSRFAMDHSIWSMENLQWIRLAPEWLEVSSFMPQKAHASTAFEHMRITCHDIIGQMTGAVTAYKGEPLQDVLTILFGPNGAVKSLCLSEQNLGWFHTVLANTEPNVVRMREALKTGYSGAPDLAVKLIRDKGYGGRKAHRMCALMIRKAKETGVASLELTGEMLDEAARTAEIPEPKLTTEEVQSCMSLEHFFEWHCNIGDPCPKETRRMVENRRRQLDEWSRRQEQRRARLNDAEERLNHEIDSILREGEAKQ